MYNVLGQLSVIFTLALKSNTHPQVRSHGGAFGGSALQFFLCPPQMIETRKNIKFCKGLFSICLIVTPTRNITTCCVKATSLLKNKLYKGMPTLVTIPICDVTVTEDSLSKPFL